MNPLQTTLERGRALLAARQPAAPSVAAERPAPGPPAPRRDRHRTFFEPPAAAPADPAPEGDWEADLLARARQQLETWIEVGADYAAVRLDLIAHFAATCRTNPDYATLEAGRTLEGGGVAALTRRGLIEETLARWVWLQKRGAGTPGDYGGPLRAMTPAHAADIAGKAVAEEIQRRR